MKYTLLLAAIAVAAVAAGSVTASHAARASVPACPGHAPKLVSSGAPAGPFVRPGATAMRLCRYYGVNWGDAQGLRRQRLIRASVTIGRITSTFNGLREPPRGIFCVRDDGSELLVVFGYPNQAERVAVKLTGCRFAMNGRSTRWSTPRLQHRLLNLVKSR
jgi:hypothetical protein